MWQNCLEVSHYICCHIVFSGRPISLIILQICPRRRKEWLLKTDKLKTNSIIRGYNKRVPHRWREIHQVGTLENQRIWWACSINTNYNGIFQESVSTRYWFLLKCHITLRKKVLLSLVAIAAVANHLTACISGQNVWAAVRWVAIGKANAIIPGELKFWNARKRTFHKISRLGIFYS